VHEVLSYQNLKKQGQWKEALSLGHGSTVVEFLMLVSINQCVAVQSDDDSLQLSMKRVSRKGAGPYEDPRRLHAGRN
jgi:hypothetical protein